MEEVVLIFGSMSRAPFETALLFDGWALVASSDEDGDCIGIYERNGWTVSVSDDAVYLVPPGKKGDMFEFVDKAISNWQPDTRYVRAWRAMKAWCY